MKTLPCLVSLSLLVFACSKKEDKAAAPPADNMEPAAPQTTPPSPEPAVAVLTIKAAKLSFEKAENNPDGPTSLALDEAGKIWVDGKELGALSAEGKLTDKDGKVLVTIAADGTLTAAGVSESVTIGADGTMTKDGETLLSIGADGAVVGKDLSEKIVFEGPDESKRAMMVVFTVLTLTGEESVDMPAVEPGEAVEAPKAAPEPE